MRIVGAGLLIVLSIALAGCSRKEAKRADGRMLAFSEIESETTTGDFFNEVEVVVLEDNDESLISSIRGVVADDSLYYVRDARNRVMAFRRDGRHKFTIDDIGAGPEEYMSIVDMALDPVSGRLVLLVEGKLMYYDGNGHLVSQEKVEGLYREFLLTPSRMVLAKYPYPNGLPAESVIRVVDRKSGEATEFLAALPPYMPFAYGNTRTLTKVGNDVFFSRKFDNRIYAIGDDGATEAYTIDWNGHGFVPQEGRQYEYMELSDMASEAKQVFSVSNFAEGDSAMYFSTNLGAALMLKTDGRLNVYSVLRAEGYGVALSSGFPLDGDRPEIVFAVQPLSVVNVAAYDSTNTSVAALARRVTEDSNPVLFRYRVK